jgi:hypothetical protein
LDYFKACYLLIKGAIMKFSDLPKDQQQVLTAWMNGETMQYLSTDGNWYNITTLAALQTAISHRPLRVKPKEPVFTYLYSCISNSGGLVSPNYSSIPELLANNNGEWVHSYIQKTFHDGVFVKAEIIPKG